MAFWITSSGSSRQSSVRPSSPNIIIPSQSSSFSPAGTEVRYVPTLVEILLVSNLFIGKFLDRNKLRIRGEFLDDTQNLLATVTESKATLTGHNPAAWAQVTAQGAAMTVLTCVFIVNYRLIC